MNRAGEAAGAGADLGRLTIGAALGAAKVRVFARPLLSQLLHWVQRRRGYCHHWMRLPGASAYCLHQFLISKRPSEAAALDQAAMR
jgi:hypothetical protein